MESTQKQKGLPAVLVLSKNIGDALELTKSIYLKSFTPKNEYSYDSLCKKALDLKIEAPFLSEKYTVDTNYYNCNLKIACFTYDFLLPILDSQDTELFIQNHEISSVEGLIFVSDLRGNKREGLDQYLKYHKEIVDKFSPELLMCFAHTHSNQEEDLFETFKFGENELFVEVINDNLEQIEPKRPDPNVQKPKFEEKYGVDRVVENFECHMWPNMVKKIGTQVKAEQPKENIENKKQEGVDKDKETSNENKEEKSAKDDKEKKDEKKGDEDKKTKAKENENNNPFEYEDEEEKEIDGIAALIDTVRQFKLSSKNLSDEDRRQKAADLLMKLVSNCPELQGDDDDDEDEEGYKNL